VPIRVSGRVWVERLEPEITLLIDVSEAIDDLVAEAQGMPSPRAFACGGAIIVPGPRADGDISLLLGVVVAGVDRPLGLPQANLCRLDALEELACP